MFENLFNQRTAGTQQENEGTDRPLRGEILGGTENVKAELYVFVETLGENARRGPCVWDPIIGKEGEVLMPGGGEECLVEFDAQGLPWITEWVPNAKTHVMQIGEVALKNESVSTSKIKLLAVTAAQIANSTITAAKYGAESVGTAALAALSVTTAKIAEEAVTPAKLSEPRPKFVSALPGSPFDGQEVYLQNAAMATAGVIWHLRYRAASTFAHKWEYIGGLPLINEQSGVIKNTTPGEWKSPSAGSFTPPLAGEYDTNIEAWLLGNTATATNFFVGIATVAKPGTALTSIVMSQTDVSGGGTNYKTLNQYNRVVLPAEPICAVTSISAGAYEYTVERIVTTMIPKAVG